MLLPHFVYIYFYFIWSNNTRKFWKSPGLFVLVMIWYPSQEGCWETEHPRMWPWGAPSPAAASRINLKAPSHSSQLASVGEVICTLWMYLTYLKKKTNKTEPVAKLWTLPNQEHLQYSWAQRQQPEEAPSTASARQWQLQLCVPALVSRSPLAFFFSFTSQQVFLGMAEMMRASTNM